jgi:surface antigen
MRSTIHSCVVGIVALGLTGCASMSQQDVGVLTGGVVGGVVGSHFGGGAGQTACILGGSIIGAMIGGSIGKSMDEVDRMKMSEALESNCSNQTSNWVNPDNGNRYSVTPKRAYRDNRGQPCREYTTVATIGGKKQEIYGTACRTQDGSWRVIS